MSVNLSAVIVEGTFATRPAAGIQGRIFFSTDTLQIYYDNGATWDNVTPSAFANPMTTVGDLIVGGAGGAAGRLASGTAGYVLTSNGPATAPSWNAPTGGSGGAPTLVPLAPSAAGNFSVAHGLGSAPSAVIVSMTSGGQIWLQSPTGYDGTDLYLVASDAGVTGNALCF